jgi:predicted NUDIX family NTP pyrophosphohydrolase
MVRRLRGASAVAFPVGGGVPVVLAGESVILEHRGGRRWRGALKSKGGWAVVEGAYREGVVAVVAASTPMSSMVNFGTGAKKRL